MDVTHCTNYKGIDVILHVTNMDYSAGRPATGPSYSCAGEPPEPETAEATEGWVEIDGDVNAMGQLSSEEMQVIVDITNDSEGMFHAIAEVEAEDLEMTLLEAVSDDEGPDYRFSDDN